MIQIGTVAEVDLRERFASEISLLHSSFSSIVNSMAFSEIKNDLILALKTGRDAIESQIRERYTLEENDGYCVVVNFNETHSKYELEQSTLLLTMENLAYAGLYEACIELLERCTNYYKIEFGSFSYDKQSYNRFTTEGFSQKLVHSCVESYLISGDVSGYIAALTNHRMDLTPSMLIQSTLRLIYGFNKRPDPRIYSILFGGSIESSQNGEKAKRIGEISLDKQLRQFLSESGLGFNTTGLIKCLDSFFDYYSDKEPGWFKAAYEKAFSGRFIKSNSTDCYTAGVFNYKGWGRGRESACFTWDKDVLYPDDSLENVKYCISKEINLNKDLRNFTREYLGLPRVGEGQWIGELSLLKMIRDLTNLKVVHQWSPEWLSPQRIDVGLPSIGLGFEFNGLQHYEPVEYFGGEKAFWNQRKRDTKKKRLCEKNNVRLVEIRFDLSLEKVQEVILSELNNCCPWRPRHY